MKIALAMVFSLALILFGAELFTNAVEWLGRRLGLGQSAVGSVLAALGTAIPETAVPVTAILFGAGAHDAIEVGIGGILGAPFLLTTLGSLVIAVALLTTRRTEWPELGVVGSGFPRDMTFFLIAYAFTMLVGCVDSIWLHRSAPIILVALYVLFLVLTLRDRSTSGSGSEDIHPLYLHRKSGSPTRLVILIQLLLALGLIVGGAQLLTFGVERLATWMTIPAFVLSALLIPLATELPETFNSVVWIRQGKDALAFGNITGAMVFQSTLVPALGIWMTPWRLTPQAMITGALTLCAAAMIFGLYRMSGRLSAGVFLSASLLYWILPLQIVAVRYQLESFYWVCALIVGLACFLSVRIGLRRWRDA